MSQEAPASALTTEEDGSSAIIIAASAGGGAVVLLIILAVVYFRCYKRRQTEKADITATATTVQVSKAAVDTSELELAYAQSAGPVDHLKLTEMEEKI